MAARFCDELPFGFGWILDETYERCSHALVHEGRVWLVDPVEAEGVEERVRARGEPAGVIQLLDRHNRSCASFAARLGVPHHLVPREPFDGAPFEFLLVRKGRRWQEVALWWRQQRLLLCADALGTGRFYRARGERLAVHPLLRPIPPRRRLGGISPGIVLCGHGEGILEDAEPAFREALATARRRLPAWLASVVRARRERRADASNGRR